MQAKIDTSDFNRLIEKQRKVMYCKCSFSFVCGCVYIQYKENSTFWFIKVTKLPTLERFHVYHKTVVCVYERDLISEGTDLEEDGELWHEASGQEEENCCGGQQTVQERLVL